MSMDLVEEVEDDQKTMFFYYFRLLFFTGNLWFCFYMVVRGIQGRTRVS